MEEKLVKKEWWLRKYKEKIILIVQEGRNDGIAMFRNVGVSFGRAIDKIQMYPMYLTEEEEINWKKRPIKIKGKTYYAYDVISINTKDVPQLIDALNKLTGAPIERVEKTLEDEKKETQLQKDMVEFGL